MSDCCDMLGNIIKFHQFDSLITNLNLAYDF